MISLAAWWKLVEISILTARLYSALWEAALLGDGVLVGAPTHQLASHWALDGSYSRDGLYRGACIRDRAHGCDVRGPRLSRFGRLFELAQMQPKCRRARRRGLRGCRGVHSPGRPDAFRRITADGADAGPAVNWMAGGSIWRGALCAVCGIVGALHTASAGCFPETVSSPHRISDGRGAPSFIGHRARLQRPVYPLI